MRRPTRDEVAALAALAARAVQHEAGDPAFRRGAEYAETDCVRGVRFARGELRAKVRGTHRYRVVVAIDEGELVYRCDCPVGEEGAFCPHCAATVLAWLDGLRLD